MHGKQTEMCDFMLEYFDTIQSRHLHHQHLFNKGYVNCGAWRRYRKQIEYEIRQ